LWGGEVQKRQKKERELGSPFSEGHPEWSKEESDQRGRGILTRGQIHTHSREIADADSIGG